MIDRFFTARSEIRVYPHALPSTCICWKRRTGCGTVRHECPREWHGGIRHVHALHDRATTEREVRSRRAPSGRRGVNSPCISWPCAVGPPAGQKRRRRRLLGFRAENDVLIPGFRANLRGVLPGLRAFKKIEIRVNRSTARQCQVSAGDCAACSDAVPSPRPRRAFRRSCRSCGEGLPESSPSADLQRREGERLPFRP